MQITAAIPLYYNAHDNDFSFSSILVMYDFEEKHYNVFPPFPIVK